jgi:uncharacterized protein DUF6894
MTHYYLHFRNGDEFTPDPEGIDLPSLAAARDKARHAAKEMAGDMVLTQDGLDARRFEIADETGQIVLAVQFRDLMEVAGDELTAHHKSIARWDDEGGAASSSERSQATVA